MRIGYGRVSRQDQDTAAQAAALKQAKCDRVFTETASGGRFDRAVLQKMLDQLRPKDMVVVWKLDRLSRSLIDLLKILKTIEDKGAGFRSLTEAIDTTNAAGRMMMQMLGAFAEFERSMIIERTKAGIEHARSEGRIGGRKPKLTVAQRKEVRRLVSSGQKTMADCSRLFNVSRPTITRVMRESTN